MPADETHFLTTDEVLAIHERLIETFGGTRGLRDPGLLARSSKPPDWR